MNKKIFSTGVLIFFLISCGYAQNTGTTFIDIEKLANDSIIFRKEKSIDNVHIKTSQILYSEAEYDSVVYCLYKHKKEKNPFTCISKRKSNFIDKTQFSSASVNFTSANNKRVLLLNFYLLQ